MKPLLRLLLGLALCCLFLPAFAGPDSRHKPLPPACAADCATPYGQVLGITPEGTRAYSNCSARCVVFEPNRERGAYTGIRWQCVEFARRWLMVNEGLSFGDVDVAADIWGRIDHFDRPADRSTVTAQNFPNGSSTPPQRGDLLVYAREYLGTGHVAVVVGAGAGHVTVAEQNFSNEKWPGDYARRIERVEKEGRHWLLDPYLLGWKRPR